MDEDIQQQLFWRLRRSASASSVQSSLPVLFFGDIFNASIATVGLNPSDKEYLDKHGLELADSRRRFETLRSLGAVDRSTLTDEQCSRAIMTMCTYYKPGKPVYSWFNHLDRVTRGMGFSYSTGQIVHLDLVQEATTPTWSRLSKVSPDEFAELRNKDISFLKWELKTFHFQYVVCNGKTVLDQVGNLIGFNEAGSGAYANLKWRVGRSDIRQQETWVVGWNLPLAQPTGLRTEDEYKLGAILFGECKTI